MNTKKDFSPEERLLRLIRGAKKKEMPKPEESAPKIEIPGGLSGPAIPAPIYKEENSAPRAKSISVPPLFRLKTLNTGTLNVVLVVILACLLLYFIFDFAYTVYFRGERDIFTEGAGEPVKVENGGSLEVKPYSYYASAIEGRNIFMPQQVETEAVITGPTLAEVSSNLSLIGIIAGSRPQAIIEDKKTAKSHFLYKGGFIGGAKIIDILEGSVIMEYQGEKFELVL